MNDRSYETLTTGLAWVGAGCAWGATYYPDYVWWFGGWGVFCAVVSTVCYFRRHWSET